MGDKQDERRKEILEAALAAFLETGFDKTSMDDVVRATGLSKGTIYWYFKNKQELYVALMEYVIDGFFEEFEHILSTAHDMPPYEAVKAMFGSISLMLDANPKVASLTVDFMMQALHYPDMREKYAAYYARYINEVGTIIQRGIDSGTFRQVDARAAAATLIGTMDGVMLQALLGEELNLDWQWQAKHILDTAEALFSNGLLNNGGQG